MCLLSHIYEALEIFKRFVAEVQTLLEQGVKIFRTDRGREYLSHTFKEFYEEKVYEDSLRLLVRHNKWCG